MTNTHHLNSALKQRPALSVAENPIGEPPELNIDQFKNEEGLWVCPHNEAEYDDPSKFIMEGIFGWCGCGDPTSAFNYVMETMEHIHKLREGGDTSRSGWDAFYKQWSQEEKEIHGTHGAHMIIYYVLDERELTEHGGAVPGWLTQDGVRLLEDMQTIANNQQFFDKQ